jgi:hypothetical protein
VVLVLHFAGGGCRTFRVRACESEREAAFTWFRLLVFLGVESAPFVTLELAIGDERRRVDDAGSLKELLDRYSTPEGATAVGAVTAPQRTDARVAWPRLSLLSLVTGAQPPFDLLDVLGLCEALLEALVGVHACGQLARTLAPSSVVVTADEYGGFGCKLDGVAVGRAAARRIAGSDAVERTPRSDVVDFASMVADVLLAWADVSPAPHSSASHVDAALAAVSDCEDGGAVLAWLAPCLRRAVDGGATAATVLSLWRLAGRAEADALAAAVDACGSSGTNTALRRLLWCLAWWGDSVAGGVTTAPSDAPAPVVLRRAVEVLTDALAAQALTRAAGTLLLCRALAVLAARVTSAVWLPHVPVPRLLVVMETFVSRPDIVATAVAVLDALAACAAAPMLESLSAFEAVQRVRGVAEKLVDVPHVYLAVCRFFTTVVKRCRMHNAEIDHTAIVFDVGHAGWFSTCRLPRVEDPSLRRSVATALFRLVANGFGDVSADAPGQLHLPATYSPASVVAAIVLKAFAWPDIAPLVDSLIDDPASASCLLLCVAPLVVDARQRRDAPRLPDDALQRSAGDVVDAVVTLALRVADLHRRRAATQRSCWLLLRCAGSLSWPCEPLELLGDGSDAAVRLAAGMVVDDIADSLLPATDDLVRARCFRAIASSFSAADPRDIVSDADTAELVRSAVSGVLRRADPRSDARAEASLVRLCLFSMTVGFADDHAARDVLTLLRSLLDVNTVTPLRLSQQLLSTSSGVVPFVAFMDALGDRPTVVVEYFSLAAQLMRRVIDTAPAPLAVGAVCRAAGLPERVAALARRWIAASPVNHAVVTCGLTALLALVPAAEEPQDWVDIAQAAVMVGVDDAADDTATAGRQLGAAVRSYATRNWSGLAGEHCDGVRVGVTAAPVPSFACTLSSPSPDPAAR